MAARVVGTLALMQQKKYACKACGQEYLQWQGRCPHCQEWDSLTKIVQPVGGPSIEDVPQPQVLRKMDFKEDMRFSTGISEFDRALGGGLVAGSIILIGGNPGTGKSTLLLQALAHLAARFRVCYVSGEESSNQLLMHAHRLGIQDKDIFVLAEKQLERILAAAEEFSPQVLVVDSIQVTYSAAQPSSAGGVSQVRECALRLMEYAKSSDCTVILVGHVTKEGQLAGPNVLEHTVDASLLLESTDDVRFRTLRAQKNRFGALNEIGLFAMTEQGMKPVRNPSAIFLSQQKEPRLGSSTAIVREGSRSLLVEIQALVDTQVTAYPRRIAVGLDSQRLMILLAVLSCHCSLNFTNSNVFVNVVGGLRIEETSTDLPCLLSLVSVLTKRFLPFRSAAFGEVGLNGEIRPQPFGQERIAAAVRHGFKQLIIPQANMPRTKPPEIQLRGVSTVAESLQFCFAANGESDKIVPPP